MLIQIGVKHQTRYEINMKCLRALLIQIGIKRHISSKHKGFCLRALLIQIGIKLRKVKEVKLC